MRGNLFPHLGELLLWHRLNQLVVKLQNSLEVVQSILTGNCIFKKNHTHTHTS